jgi:uncharacterized repeat protein (TIGR03803 family)
MKARMNSVKVLSGTLISNRQRCALLASAFVLLLIAVTSAQAQTYTVLFNGQAGGSLVRDAAGNLYGVSGTTVFKLSTSGVVTQLHMFPSLQGWGTTRGSGINPDLILDPAGNLYGTTPQGGLQNCFIQTSSGFVAVGCGTVFKLDAAGGLTTLYSFKGGNTGPDGAFVSSGLTRSAAGNLYGSTDHGGTYNCSVPGVIALGCGTGFKLDTSGNETILGSNGYNPGSGLVLDAAGNIYGVRGESILKLDKSGTYTVLYAFTSGTDGGNPQGSLAIDASGSLYGTTNIGGLSSCMTGGAAIGCGVVFKLDLNGQETVLYTFTGGSNDGANPNGGLVLDSSGNIYGTTSHGGSADFGTVFKLDPNGVETQLHDFTNGADGGSPKSGVVLDAAGNLYGSASTGGDPSCGSSGCGVIFKIAPAKPDFSISASAFSPNRISPGGSASSTLSITSVAGFSGKVSLSCSVKPSSALSPKCSITPNSVMPGNAATLTLTTTGPSGTLRSKFGSGLFYALWLPLMGLVVRTRPFGTKEKTRRNGVAAGMLLGGILAISLVPQIACGGGASSTSRLSNGTPTGSYTITVTGADSSGSLQHSATTTVTVQ